MALPDKQESKLPYGSNLDTLIAEMSAPKQNFTPPTPPQGAQSPGSPPGWTPPEIDTDPVTPMDPEAAKRQGERLARTIDGGLSFAAAMYAKEESTEKYKASPGEITDLGNALGDLSLEYNIKLNPWVNVIFLMVMIYGPKFMAASNDRRFNIMADKMKEMQEKIESLEKKKDILEKEDKA